MSRRSPVPFATLGIVALLLSTASGENVPTPAAPARVRRIEIKGIENAYQLGSRFISGSAPANDEAFKALAKLGIRTLISVDGAKPDVEAARRNGLRYVHLPHGYDGIPRRVATRLIKAAAALPGRMYIHCHHGKHRGPAAAALLCEATEGWSGAEATEWLKRAGTAPEYAGLYETVAAFRTPSAEELTATPSEFPESVEVSTLVDAMVTIDSLWDDLKQPRIAPALAIAKAALLREQFRELQRAPEASKRGSDFIESLLRAENAAAALSANAARPQGISRENASARVRSMQQRCTECHHAHRDPPKADAGNVSP